MNSPPTAVHDLMPPYARERRHGLNFPAIAALVALAATLLSTNVLVDADSYWHVATGRWILAHGTVPTADPFSHSMPGTPWTAHEWGSEVLLAAVFDSAGWQGLLTLAAVCFALTVAVILRFLLDRMEPLHAVVLGFVCITLVQSHLLARPHVIVWPLTAIWLATLVQCVERERTPPWWLLAVYVLWTNLHASFTLGGGFAAVLALDAAWRHEAWSARFATLRRWMPFLVVAAACTLINPEGIGAITNALRVMRMGRTLALVHEWQSADFHQFQPFLVWLLALIALALRATIRMGLWRLVLMLGLVYLALKHQRYHALVGLVSPFLLAAPLAAGIRAIARGASDAAALDRWFEARSARATLASVALTVVLAAGVTASAAALQPARPQRGITPDAALAAARGAGVTSGKVFNAYGFGGFLIYAGVPVFVDGRGDMYGDEFMGALSDAVNVSKPGALESMLSRYDIGWTMLPPSTPAVQMLDYLPGWRRIHRDSVAVVHARSTILSRPSSP